MKVFISWSGALSKALAAEIRDWLPAVIQAVQPYFSPDDIAKGTRWGSEIAQELEASSVGIICLTPDNLEAPWILFEAGALAKKLDKARVCPIVFGLSPTDVKDPLAQFQAARFEKQEIKRVIDMMNGELNEQALDEGVLKSVFEMWWPKLEESVAEILANPQQEEGEVRTERDILEEILALTRRSTSLPRHSRINPSAFGALVTHYRDASYTSMTQSNSDISDILAEMHSALHYICKKGGANREIMILLDEVQSMLGEPRLSSTAKVLTLQASS